MALQNVSVKATDVKKTKLLLLNEHQVANILPCGV